ncbi:hypothetical protein [Pseudonocardia lacus]|uniref:hypothetical protein n=1 Tax=Pseudonocardia lacus TaxID=2835865 RepID=UPI001BDCA443|nr:hypothetical protein [Pseudonocardia lacus]
MSGLRGQAHDLVSWLQWVAEGLRVAWDASGGPAFIGTFNEWFFDEPEDDDSPVPEREHAAVLPVFARDARRSGDPVLAGAALELPDDAYLVDLRAVAPPVELPFQTGEWPGGTAVYRRFHGGTVVAAVPADV